MPAPAFLLIDIGNTRTKWATAAARGAIRVAGNLETNQVDKVALVSLRRSHAQEIVVVACVVPRLVPILRSVFGSRLHLVSGISPYLGLSFLYPKPAEIGADRLAACVAAVKEEKGAAIVINCGTATALNLLDDSGRFCGGVIAPGLETQLASLIDRTGQLPATSLREPRSLPSKSTADAIRAGVLLNFRGGVNEIVRKLSASPGTLAPRIVLTGGTASYLVGKLDRPARLRPLLVFEGLRIMAARIS